MQEFSSVSASAYDAESLTTQLDEKSAEGWDVVSIVSAGSNVVAYLTREASDEAPVADAEAAEEAAVEEAVVEEAVVEEAAVEEAVVEEAVVEEAAVAEAVDEPAGWATAPDDEGADPTPTDAAAAATGAAAAATAADTPADAPATETAAETGAEEAAAAAPESTVPAGWYSDPSGRYELRYWDGSAWTEHVSRAGQQYTDPPVA